MGARTLQGAYSVWGVLYFRFAQIFSRFFRGLVLMMKMAQSQNQNTFSGGTGVAFPHTFYQNVYAKEHYMKFPTVKFSMYEYPAAMLSLILAPNPMLLSLPAPPPALGSAQSHL